MLFKHWKEFLISKGVDVTIEDHNLIETHLKDAENDVGRWWIAQVEPQAVFLLKASFTPFQMLEEHDRNFMEIVFSHASQDSTKMP